MSDGPLPKSIEDGVDSSPDAIAAMHERLEFSGLPEDLAAEAAALLAQVARERDEARALREQMRVDRFHECESVRAEAKAAIAAAERQLAEARAALTMVAHYGDAFPEGTDMLAACRDVAARVLSAGETT